MPYVIRTKQSSQCFFQAPNSWVRSTSDATIYAEKVDALEAIMFSPDIPQTRVIIEKIKPGEADGQVAEK